MLLPPQILYKRYPENIFIHLLGRWEEPEMSQVCVCVCVYVCVCVCVLIISFDIALSMYSIYVCMCVCMYLYIHSYTHARIHTEWPDAPCRRPRILRVAPDLLHRDRRGPDPCDLLHCLHPHGLRAVFQDLDSRVWHLGHGVLLV